jgi:predicted ATPase
MPGLAMHNFRGFEKTSIFLHDVNFFVGENSTGKTSVLSAIEILSSAKFFFTGELASDYCDLSFFEDVTDSSNKTFSLGFFLESFQKKRTGFPDAVAFHFENKSGLASPTKIFYIANGYLIKANFHQEKVVISVEDFEKLPETPLQALEKLMWGRISTLHIGKKIGSYTYLYKKLPMPTPIIAAMNVLALEKIKREEEDPILKPRLNCSLFPDIYWGAPIRAKPEAVNYKSTKSYTPEGLHVPNIIRQVYGAQKHAGLEQKVTKQTNAFGSDSHLFNSIGVKEYGDDSSAPFEIRININNKNHKLSNVGYGVSQALPLLIQISSAENGEGFIVQQPEVHLHPRAQAAFGDFFFEMAKERGHCFLIETHSDFLIDRFRLSLYKSDASKKPTSQIIFFEKTKSGDNKLTTIPISQDGLLPNEVPAEYKEFFYKEEFEMLEIR